MVSILDYVNWKNYVMDLVDNDKKEIKRIRDLYKNRKMCGCIDEKYAGGFWDWAGAIAGDEFDCVNSEQAQEIIYTMVKELLLDADHLDCDGENCDREYEDD